MKQVAVLFARADMNLTIARQQRDTGMQAALDFAEWQDQGFTERAYAFIKRQAEIHPLLNPEQVTALAAAYGIKPKDERSFGGVWSKLQRNGIIKKSDIWYQRTKGHCTEARLWQSLICKGAL